MSHRPVNRWRSARSRSKDTVKSPPSLAFRGSGRETLLVVLGLHEADFDTGVPGRRPI